MIITAGGETESTIRLILAKADSGAADPRPNLDLPRNDDKITDIDTGPCFSRPPAIELEHTQDF